MLSRKKCKNKKQNNNKTESVGSMTKRSHYDEHLDELTSVGDDTCTTNNNKKKKMKFSSPPSIPTNSLLSRDMIFSTRSTMGATTTYASSCWLNIFTFLNINDSLSLSRTCKPLHLLHFIPQFENKIVQMANSINSRRHEFLMRNLLCSLHAITRYEQCSNSFNRKMTTESTITKQHKKRNHEWSQQQFFQEEKLHHSIEEFFKNNEISYSYFKSNKCHDFHYDHVGFIHFSACTLQYQFSIVEGFTMDYIILPSHQIHVSHHLMEKELSLPISRNEYDYDDEEEKEEEEREKEKKICSLKRRLLECDRFDEEDHDVNHYTMSVSPTVLNEVKDKLNIQFIDDDKWIVTCILYALPLDYSTIIYRYFGNTRNIINCIEFTENVGSGVHDESEEEEEAEKSEEEEDTLSIHINKSTIFTQLSKDVLKHIMDYLKRDKYVHSLAKTCHHVYEAYETYYKYCTTYFSKQLNHHLSQLNNETIPIKDYEYIQLVKQSIKKLRFNQFMKRPLNAGPIPFNPFIPTTTTTTDHNDNSIMSPSLILPHVVLTKLKFANIDYVSQYKAQFCLTIGTTNLLLTHVAHDDEGCNPYWTITIRVNKCTNNNNNNEKVLMSMNGGVLTVFREKLNSLLRSRLNHFYNNNHVLIMSDEQLVKAIISLLPWPKDWNCVYYESVELSFKSQ